MAVKNGLFTCLLRGYGFNFRQKLENYLTCFIFGVYKNPIVIAMLNHVVRFVKIGLFAKSYRATYKQKLKKHNLHYVYYIQRSDIDKLCTETFVCVIHQY